jgi:quercetin dioxygenase-like cupin family protein
MLTGWTSSMLRRQVVLRLATCLLLLGPPLVLTGTAGEDALPATLPADASPEVRMVLSTDRTVTREPIQYPSGAPAHVTAVEIVLQPGQQTGWHTHPVPLFAYILEGELTVDYGASGERTYRQGDGFAEATNQAHKGHNPGRKPVRILAVFLGAKGLRGTAPASPPTQ